MVRMYNKQNPKDRFMTERLIPYLIEHIEKSSNQKKMAERIAVMYIFPYKTKNGIEIGSLLDPGTNWYFINNKQDEDKLSTDTVRIIADDIFRRDQFAKFRRLFVDFGYISEYTGNSVILGLIKKMSQESDCTEMWWSLAYEVFSQCTPETFKLDLSEATKNIHDNYFLFRDNSVPDALKSKLIKNGVFKDVFTYAGKKQFLEKIKPSERNKAYKLLNCMGISDSFVTIEDNLQMINPNILCAVNELAEFDYPLDNQSRSYQKCELLHELIWNYIYPESPKAVERAINDEEIVYADGIPVLNVRGEFVPVSWDLFYSSAEIRAACDNELEETTEITDNGFEYLHVDVERNNTDFIKQYEKMHLFSESDEKYEDYNFIEIDESTDEIGFYKWIWSYAPHQELGENILEYYSSEDAESMEIIPDEENDFILDVLNETELEDQYYFGINLKQSEAFISAEVINKTSLETDAIKVWVYGNVTSFDPKSHVSKLMEHTYPALKRKIENDAVWNHTYLADGMNGMFPGIYVRANLFVNGIDEDMLLMCPSEDTDSYYRALRDYINNTYDVNVDLPYAELVDWGTEYENLTEEIYRFISRKKDKRTAYDLADVTADLFDIRTFGEERKLWYKLEKERDTILTANQEDSPVDIKNTRPFLSAKYHGRCQLCGQKTITGEQNAHFYTYRIIKQKDNHLANLESNLFCLCPSCHGELGYGDFMGRDMTEISKKALSYAVYLKKHIQEKDMEDNYPCLIKEVFDDQQINQDEKAKLKGFKNPIVCRVTVNGKKRLMAFSWEHFIRIAFILSEAAK